MRLNKPLCSFLLAILLCVSLFSSLAMPATAVDGIPIDAAHFPDRYMRLRISEKYDTNHDNYLSQAEINAVTYFDLGDYEASCEDLTGILYFTEVKTIRFGHSHRDITSCYPKGLDFRGLQKLETLYINYYSNGTLLKNVTLGDNPSLTTLSLEAGVLVIGGITASSVNLSAVPSLKHLYFSGKNNDTVDVSRNPFLNEAVVHGTKTTSNRTYKYTLGDFSVEVVNSTTVKSAGESINPFKDVAKGKYYYDAVLWAFYHQPQVTGGTGDGDTFSPNNTCTREQIVTFLWKAAGAPTPSSASNPFYDVKQGKYYYNAVLWAVEKGITSGIGDGKFGVGQPCTREQIVTFLWKAKGSPSPGTSTNPFSDVKKGKYYFEAVLWAYKNNITSGIGDGLFGVGNTCKRGDVMTFLYKVYK